MDDKLKNEKTLPASTLAKTLTAVAIGRYFGITAIRTNSIMSELGWIKKGSKGWEVTELGKSLGGAQSTVRNSGATYVSWPAAILADKRLLTKMAVAKGGAETGQEKEHDTETLTASVFIDRLIANTPDWRGKILANLRRIIHKADPEIIEEWKWMGAPVWSHTGIVCIGGILKDKVVLTIANGALLPDPAKLFNASLTSAKGRAIDFFEGDKINELDLKALIRSGVEYNLAKAQPAKSRASRKKA